MLIYKSFNSKESIKEYIGKTSEYTFGNIGFSRTECAKIPIDWLNEDQVTIKVVCQASTVLGKVRSSGMMLDKQFGGQSQNVNDCFVNLDDPI